MTDHSDKEKQIMAVHTSFWDALANRDTELRFRFCADDITFIGTGLNERAENKVAYKLINQKGIEQFPDLFKMEFLWTHLTVFENTAWVECEVIWTQEIDNEILKERVRNTTILKHENNKWWVVHVHGSSPDYRLQDGDYMTNAKTIIRNNELERQVHERTAELNKLLQDLKATQAQLIQAEKMASLGELTAGIAHEIQNPLNFVNNFSEVNIELIDEMQTHLKAGKMDEAISVSNNIKENEEKISHHGKRAEGIVKGMLQHSRSSSGQKEVTDINNLVDECLRLSFHGMRAKDNSFNSKTTTDFDESQPKVNINPQDIGRVLLNLFTNSFYSVTQKRKQGGEGYEPLVSVKTVVSVGHVSITIRDNGNGIPQQALDKIFHPFFTTKPTGQGTGLGLSISYDIITKGHGGELKAETKEGEFAEFTIILPL